MKGLQFGIEPRADGLRIYARRDQDIVGALHAETSEGEEGVLVIAMIYVVPRWRGWGIAKDLRECFHTQQGKRHAKPSMTSSAKHKTGSA